MASIKTHLTLLDGLLAYYKLDGNANDAHTNALHGTPEGIPTWAANCKLRQGLQLNGSSQCVSLGLSSLLCPGNITLSCWAYVDSTGGAYQTMINKRYYAPGGGYTVISYIFTIYLPTNLITTVVSSGDSAPYWHQIDYSAGSGIRNSWHHYAMTYDGSVLAVYLDGFLRQTLTGCLGPIKERPTIATLIGARTGDSGEPSRYDYFKGYIDEVLISGRAFTPAEVRDLYHTGYPLRYAEVPATDLVAIAAHTISDFVGSATIPAGMDYERSSHPLARARDVADLSLTGGICLPQDPEIIYLENRLLPAGSVPIAATRSTHPAHPQNVGTASGVYIKRRS